MSTASSPPTRSAATGCSSLVSLQCSLPRKRSLLPHFLEGFEKILWIELDWLWGGCRKYEEISPPHVEDFCYITDNTYTRQELLTMESDILKLLNFEIGSPTIKTFLRRFTRSGPEDKKRSSLLLEFMGSYLAELSLLDYSCLRFLPSVVAASSLFLARLTIGPDTNPWGKEMHKLTGYKASELKDCIIAIHDLQLNRKGQSLPAIRDKYKQHRFKCVSMLLPPVEIPASYFQDLTE
uniref:Cyclin C-terminal domain-containing protein n=1 Tax=Aegilops tauschii subsp. strangulata TaxID=200361 RepID=A0A453JVJ8_AEGTS